jgi:hypothetical protein
MIGHDVFIDYFRLIVHRINGLSFHVFIGDFGSIGHRQFQANPFPSAIGQIHSSTLWQVYLISDRPNVFPSMISLISSSTLGRFDD